MVRVGLAEVAQLLALPTNLFCEQARWFTYSTDKTLNTISALSKSGLPRRRSLNSMRVKVNYSHRLKQALINSSKLRFQKVRHHGEQVQAGVAAVDAVVAVGIVERVELLVGGNQGVL